MIAYTPQDDRWLQSMGVSLHGQTKPQPAQKEQPSEPMVPRRIYHEVGDLACFYEGEAWRKQRRIERLQLLVAGLALLSIFLVAIIAMVAADRLAVPSASGAAGAGRVRVTPPSARVISTPVYLSGLDIDGGPAGVSR